MSNTDKLAAAASAIATAPDIQALLDIFKVLCTIPEADWDRVIESAKLMCRGRQIEKPRKQRSDVGRPRPRKYTTADYIEECVPERE